MSETVRIVEVGPRDVAKGQAFAKRRTGGDKFAVPFDGAAAAVAAVLDEMQDELLRRATAFQAERTYAVGSWDEFVEKIESQPGFYRVPWGGDDADGRAELIQWSNARAAVHRTPAADALFANGFE